MPDTALKYLSDLASEAHSQIQQAHAAINPVVGVRQGMRDIGIPADAMTIDCLRTRRRILLVLHDESPGMVMYQFTTLAEEMSVDFKQVALAQISSQTLYKWMEEYFSEATH